MKLPVVSQKTQTGIFFLVLFCTIYILHNNIFDRDIIGPHSWRQSYTQQNIDCFYEEDNNILHPRTLGRRGGTGINPQEFPLLQWTIAQTYHVLGQSIRSTRILCFLFGLTAITGFFLLLKNLSLRRSTWYAGTVLFSFSPLLFYYMMNPLPDLLAFTCAVWSLFFYARAHKEQKMWLFISGTFFLSLATAAKLPYILFGGVPIGLFYLYIRSKNKPGRNNLLWSAPLMIPPLAWYAYTLPGMQNNATLGGIFNSIVEGDSILNAITGNLTYSLPVLFLGYAATPLFVCGIIAIARNGRKLLNEYLPYTLCSILLVLYFLYESNLISTIHDYYMMPFLVPLFLIAAFGFQMLYQLKWTKWIALALVVISPFVANDVIQPRWNPGVTEYCHDLFQFRDELRAAVPDTAMVVMGNDLTMTVMPYYIHKKGWTYVDGELQRKDLESYMQSGATYLYTNSAVTLGDTAIRKLLKREVGVYGTIHIFELSASGNQ